jgi:hypothetical protein
MSQIIVLKAGEYKLHLCDTYSPSARFQIPSELWGDEYIYWLTGVFANFIRSLSSNRRNRFVADRFYFSPSGEEGSVGAIYIGDELFCDCKLFAYDGQGRHIADDWKGVWMCNHSDMLGKVEPLYKLATKFEDYLRSQQIPYRRFGKKLGVHAECEQITQQR